jgi:murein hydrolase activator
MASRTCTRVFRSVVVVAIAVAAAAAQTPSSDRERADAAAKRTSERLRALQREADSLASQARTLLADLRKLEVDRQIAVEQLTRIERDRSDTQKKLEAAEARAAELARRAEAQLPDVEARLVQLYKLGRAGYWRLLLSVEDMRALGRAYRMASTMTAIDRARITEHYATLDALARERKTLQTRAEELSGLQAEASRTRAGLEKAVAGREALVKSIDERRDLNAQLAGELQTAQERLQTSIAQIESGKEGAVLPLRPFQGELPWPAAGQVTRRFGRQPAARSGAAVVRNGMDIGATEGEPVRAIHEGTVAYADPYEGYGTLVIVDHGNRSYSLYGYLGELEVSRGQRIAAQTILGRAGRDPSGNPALYFELRIDGGPVDPLQWLKRQP